MITEEEAILQKSYILGVQAAQNQQPALCPSGLNSEYFLKGYAKGEED